LSTEDRRRLAQRYAPILVTFPEREELGPPNGAHPRQNEFSGDYHPRPVDIVLDWAYLYPGLRGKLQDPRRLLCLDQGHPLIRHLPEFLRRRFPEPEPNARREISRTVRGDPFVARASVLDLVGIGRDRVAARKAWERYFAILANDTEGRYAPCVYARVLQGDEVIEWSLIDRLRWYFRVLQIVDTLKQLAQEIETFFEQLEEAVDEILGEVQFKGNPRDVAIQYWFLYFYNDWHNRHEVDWEGITLILRADDDRVTVENLVPQVVGYASHVSGRRRPWCDVEREGTHPVVYVARGSHASYFNYRPEGYAAGIPIAIKIPWVNATITSQIRRVGLGHRDWVADPATHPQGSVLLHPGQDYQVRLLPNLDPRSRRFDADDLRDLDWLVYPGLWGDRPLFSIGGSGPKGPLWHGLRSDNPFEWVRRECAPDDRYSP
jgi:hypothetical protein